MSGAGFLLLLAVFICVAFVQRPVLKWVLETVPTQRIASETNRRVAVAALTSLTITSLYAVAFVIAGLGLSLVSFALLFVGFGVLEYFFPNRR
jgi:hypothetical protein